VEDVPLNTSSAVTSGSGVTRNIFLSTSAGATSGACPS
jgi:hypothetical protein